MENHSDKFVKEFAKLNPSGLIELFVLDATDIGGDKLYFCDGTRTPSRPELPNRLLQFQGITYQPLPIEVSGFEFRAKGQLPSPTIRFSNVMGVFTSLSLLYDDMVGAKLIRKRTLRKFLDDGTDPSAAELPEDIYIFERKVSETKSIVEYELGTLLDVEGVKLPKRQVTANLCNWRYRGPECGFAQNRFVSDMNGKAYPLNFPLSRYRGQYSATESYSKWDGVSVSISNNEEWFYLYVSESPTTGTPINTEGYWQLVQRYRGAWNKDATYITNDVVSVEGKNGVLQYYLMFANQGSGESSRPPNSSFWIPEQCNKRLTACAARFDSLKVNLPLPYGGFPGTSRTPDL
jgi:lambda family phage minor tail protein L